AIQTRSLSGSFSVAAWANAATAVNISSETKMLARNKMQPDRREMPFIARRGLFEIMQFSTIHLSPSTIN
ncbi:MAG TPA: hypothetical protein VLI65_03905, partial [Pyrinomonadaceae bacterium]|nr:hypothetical protein [Pyrinomonadaceae bacterium]